MVSTNRIGRCYTCTFIFYKSTKLTRAHLAANEASLFKRRQRIYNAGHSFDKSTKRFRFKNKRENNDCILKNVKINF